MISDVKKEQLEKLLTTCRSLDADVRYQPDSGHFIALAWEEWDDPDMEEKARSMQAQIKQMTAHYPDLVCYCFDPYSTLVYTV